MISDYENGPGMVSPKPQGGKIKLKLSYLSISSLTFPKVLVPVTTCWLVSYQETDEY